MKTIYAAITLFSLTAIFGMYLLSLILYNKETPRGAAAIHGLFAITGLALLIIFSRNNEQSPIVSIVLFTLAAVGGLMLIYKDVTGKKIPKWLAVVHGVTAVIGFGFLILFACCHP